MSRKFTPKDKVKDKETLSVTTNEREDTNESRRGKRSSNSKRSKGSRKPKENTLIRGDRNNDPNWYFTNAEIATQASQLSFQSILGYSTAEGYKVPTILRIPVVLNPGCTYNVEHRAGGLIVSTSTAHPSYSLLPGKAGVNLMAAKLYTTMSSFTGRTASYAPQDVAMMIMAISSIAEISEHIRRMFGLALTYNFWNRTMSLGLLRTMNLDVEDFIANLSVYRMQFNVAMSRINQVPLLDNIGIIKKSRDIFQQVYLDDTTAMAQMFYYEPKYYFVLDEVGDSNGSVLRSREWRNSGAADKMSDFLLHLNTMITAVLESSTLNFIYADLLNMANKLKTPMWKFDYLAENYTVMPTYNQNAILQLHNSVAIGSPRQILENGKQVQKQVTAFDYYVTGAADIFCDADKNNIRYNPIFQVTSQPPRFTQTIVDMPTDTPSVEDRLEALRFASLASGYTISGSSIGLPSPDDTKLWAIFNALPDHYITSYQVCTNVDYAAQTLTEAGFRSSDWAASATVMSVLSQFKGAPLYRIPDSGQTGWDYIAGDLAFWTDVDYDYIKRLLDITYVGLFDFRVKSGG